MPEKSASKQFAEELVMLLKSLEPGGKLGAISNPQEWEDGMNTLSSEHVDLTRELARFVDLWRYLREQGISLDREITQEMVHVHRLSVEERTKKMREINQSLMRKIANDAGTGAQFRQ